MTSAMDLHGTAHVERYLQTDGADGYEWRNGTTILNLEADAAVEQEKPAMWSAMTEVWPDDDGYQRKTTREIPVVVLERTP